jgi:hypothetical protein
MTTTQTKEQMHTVCFSGTYFSLFCNIMAENEEQAIANACALIEDQHGFNLTAESYDAWAEVAQ